MSLKSLPMPPIPEETSRVAQAVFPRGNVVMQVVTRWEASTLLRHLLPCSLLTANLLYPRGGWHW